MALLSRQERRHFPDWDNPEECRYQRPAIDLEKCDGCKLCAVICPGDVLELFGLKGEKKARVREENRCCISCNNCHSICDTGAIAATTHYDFTGYYRQLGRGAFSKPRLF